jgi:hypothetical protein
MLFRQELPAYGRGIHRRDGIPPGIISSWTRNPPEEWLFRRELPAYGRGIHRRDGILPGITISWTRNLSEEGDSTTKYQLIDSDLDGQDQNEQKIL